MGRTEQKGEIVKCNIFIEAVEYLLSSTAPEMVHKVRILRCESTSDYEVYYYNCYSGKQFIQPLTLEAILRFGTDKDKNDQLAKRFWKLTQSLFAKLVPPEESEIEYAIPC